RSRLDVNGPLAPVGGIVAVVAEADRLLLPVGVVDADEDRLRGVEIDAEFGAAAAAARDVELDEFAHRPVQRALDQALEIARGREAEGQRSGRVGMEMQ